MKIYIAGKITGEPIRECYEKFWFASDYICLEMSEIMFTEIINPLELKGIYFGITHQKAMDICLDALKECTHAYFLKDWKESEGAKIEHKFCIDNGIKIIYQT